MRMNRDIAKQNLSLVKSVLDKHHIEFWLAWGTCLGAIRERDFIAHDSDIDIEVAAPDGAKLAALIPEFEALGFTNADWWIHRGVKLVRQGVNLDIFLADPIYQNGTIIGWTTSGETLEHDFFSELEQVEFLGETYNVPKNPEAYLHYVYGLTWRQPIDYATLNAVFQLSRLIDKGNFWQFTWYMLKFWLLQMVQQLILVGRKILPAAVRHKLWVIFVSKIHKYLLNSLKL